MANFIYIVSPLKSHVEFREPFDASPVCDRLLAARRQAIDRLNECGFSVIFRNEMKNLTDQWVKEIPHSIIALLPLPGWDESKEVYFDLQVGERFSVPMIVLNPGTYVEQSLLDEIKDSYSALCDLLQQAEKEKEANVQVQTG